ncbi:MAG: methyltransferase [Acidimicrobiales bacterium]|nr:methyltransferase [Acidimicrobiales bacterium]
MPSHQSDPAKASQHYFSAAPNSPSSVREIELILPEGKVVVLNTDRGTFSPERVDAGTRALLLDAPEIADANNLVDLGCGYGPIAISMALRAQPGATVWAVDVNQRSRDLCRANAERNGVGEMVRVISPEQYPVEVKVDQLWSNPPIRIGKAALHELLRTWLDRLNESGTAAIVVQKHLGADSLARWLNEQGWNTTRRATRGQYRLLDIEAKK